MRSVQCASAFTRGCRGNLAALFPARQPVATEHLHPCGAGVRTVPRLRRRSSLSPRSAVVRAAYCATCSAVTSCGCPVIISCSSCSSCSSSCGSGGGVPEYDPGRPGGLSCFAQSQRGCLCPDPEQKPVPGQRVSIPDAGAKDALADGVRRRRFHCPAEKQPGAEDAPPAACRVCSSCFRHSGGPSRQFLTRRALCSTVASSSKG